MKKDLFNLKRSRWLLFALLTMLVGGVSPAWADAYTTGFESTDGWATISAMGGDEAKWSSMGNYVSDYELSSTYKYQGSQGLYNGQANNSSYFITPKLAKGTITFWAAGKKETGGANNYVKVFKCTDNGDGTFTIGTENLSTHSYYNYSGNDYLKCSKYSLTYTQYSFELDEDSHLAFYLSKAGIDNFSASNGLADTVVPDKAVAITAFSTTTPSLSANSENKYNASFSVTVKNNGTQDIVATDNVTVSLLDASDNVLATSDAIEISQAEGSKVVTLNYEGTSTTDQTVTFKVKDNFSDKTFATTASVTVTAYGARFAIDKTSANFGLLELNATCTPQTFEITNSGNSDLVITVGETGDAYAYKTLLFTNDKGWNDVYLYAWNNEGNLTEAFPGNKQTATGYTNEYNQPLYALFVPKGATKIIVSNGNGGSEKQSSDIVMDYTKTGLFLDNNFAGVFYGDGDLIVRANSKNLLAVGMSTATVGAKSGSIELTYTALNGNSSTVSASGVVMPAGANVVDFNDNQLPNRWTNINTYWSFANGKATGKNSNSGLLTPKLTFASGDFIVIKARRFDSDTSDYLTVKGSSDNGSTWTAYNKQLKAADGLTYPDWNYIVLSDIPTTVNKLWFVGYYAEIDEIIGLNYDQNDPEMGVYTNSECTAANKVTNASVTEAKGFVTDAPAAITYYIKNDGTGTMNLTLADYVTGMTAALGATALTAGQSTTLTLTKDATKGFFGGDAVVTAEGLGTFTVNVTGVLVDENKFDLDFTTADIPAAWTNSNWSKNSNGYIESSYSASTLETTTLTAAAGEKLVIMAKNSYTGSSYYLGVKYKKVGDENWSDLITEENQGTSWKMLVGTIAEAGDYLLQFNGKYAQVQRIYGLSKPDAPEMVVYDGNTVAGASYSFGKVTDENDATWMLTVKNEGEAALTGLAVALTGDNADHYTATIEGNKTELTKNETATITVTQLKDNLGTHSATLTISATGLDSKQIALSGETVDHTILNVDFNSSNQWPAEILEHGASWSIYYSSYSNYGYAQQNNSSTASSLILTPLTIATTTDKLQFGAWRYSNSGSYHDLNVRYTTDGGLTWNDYDWNNYEWSSDQTLRQQLSTSEKTFEITGLNAGTVAFEFNGKYVKLDNIAGDMKVTSAPLVTFTTVNDNINGANLSADGIATYTLANKGNAAYVATVAATNVTVTATGEDVTFESNTLTIPAGKTATITATMAFAAPYGIKTGSIAITSESWVGDIKVNYNATLVDPSSFVEDFAGNAKPAGWYAEVGGSAWSGWYFGNGDARINMGTAKPMITEKIGAETGKNVLSFDAKVYNGTDEQTLNVYTSTDRKTWSVAQSFTLTATEQNFSLTALADGEYYVKFEATNAVIDNLTGVKKLDAPAHDLYEVSHTMAATGIPGTSYTATVVGVSLRANETVVAELWLKKGENYHKVASLENEAMTVDVSKTFTLTGNLPTEEGEYKMWVTVKNNDDSSYFNTDEIDFTLTHTTSLYISNFVNAPAVQANDDNEYEGTFTVTVQNTGSKSLAADEVSVTLINNADANITFTKTLAGTLFMETSNGSVDIATDAKLGVWMWGASAGEWAEFTQVSDGFWCVDLKGNTGYIIVRQDPAKDFDLDDCYNKTGNIAFADGNLRSFTNWGEGKDMIFNAGTFALANNQTIPVKVTVSGTLTDGEDATVLYKAKENVSDTYYGSGLTRSVSVTAAPVIVLNESGDDAGTIASNGQNRKVTLNHSFVQGWNTICLPFAISATEIHANAKALAFTDYNAGTKELTFSPVTELEANKPYVIYVPEEITSPFSFSGKTVATSNELNVTYNGVTFQGTYAPMAAGSLDGKWGLTAGGKIAKASDTTTMKGFRAYFDGVTDLSTARVLFLDDVPTSISAITIDGNVEGVYNLQGQKVEQLRKGGLYIINGKKVVIK